MRKIFTVAIFFILPFCSIGQSLDDSVNQKSFLFEKFLMGAVRMKSGAVEHARLNYNTDDQSIVFIQNGQYMVFADLSVIDTVYIQQKKFVVFEKNFYEVVDGASPTSLLISYSNKVQPLIATANHEGTSRERASEVSNTVSDVYVNRIYKGNFSVEIIKHYLLSKNDKTYKITSKKHFLDSFPSNQRKVIENYIIANNIGFSNEADLIKLVDFCNTVSK